MIQIEDKEFSQEIVKSQYSPFNGETLLLNGPVATLSGAELGAGV